MNRTRKIVALSAAALILTGCSTVSTQSDQVSLHYAAGPLSDTKFENCVTTGTRNIDGYGDKHYTYPAGQRTFTFAKDGKDVDSAAFTVAAGNVELVLSGVARFSLNTDCDTLRKFHEQIGLKYGAYVDDGETGWNKMIATYVLQPLQRAMNDATNGADWVSLYNDPSAKAAWEKRVGELLPQYVEQTAGGEYFKDFQLTLQKPALPDQLQSALLAQQVAIQNQQTQVETNRTLELEREGIQSLVQLLGPEGYNVYTALKDGKITFMPIPEGSSVIVPQPQAAK